MAHHGREGHLSQDKPILDYDSSEPPERPPNWVYAVLVIYILACIVIMGVSVLILFMYINESMSACVPLIFMTCLVLCGLAMVIVPVRAKLKRPIKRRSVWFPITGASFLIALLAFCIIMAAGDAFHFEFDSAYFFLIGEIWLMWMLILGFFSITSNPVAMSARIYKTVIVGSLLELLTAVPLHLIARQRTECCAGIASGMAIVIGFIVALVAIGPGIFFLFYRRWKQYYAK
jgi:hypothetical protein